MRKVHVTLEIELASVDINPTANLGESSNPTYYSPREWDTHAKEAAMDLIELSLRKSGLKYQFVKATIPKAVA